MDCHKCFKHTTLVKQQPNLNMCITKPFCTKMLTLNLWSKEYLFCITLKRANKINMIIYKEENIEHIVCVFFSLSLKVAIYT